MTVPPEASIILPALSQMSSPITSVARLPPGATMNNGNIVSSNIVQPVARSQSNEVDNVGQSRLVPMPSFVNNREGEQLCASLLSQQFADGWKESLGHGNRANWIRDKLDMLYDRQNGIFKRYKQKRLQTI